MKIRCYSDLHLYHSIDDITRYDSTELLDLINLIYTDPVDLLVFCGDLTHKVYSTDDKRFVHTMNFVAKVLQACKATNTLFRIIKGTSTHDAKMIEVLKEMYENDSHLKCYTEIGYEKINDLTMRFLPEPYFDTYANFYDYAYRLPADITFFHGTIDGVIPYLSKNDNPTNLPKAVIINGDDLNNHTALFSVGGHIHKHLIIKDRIFYTNSLTTHNFSDIKNIKGFMEFNIDEYKRWNYKYIENRKAPAFHSYDIDNIHTKRKEDLRRMISNIMLQIKSNDKLRFVVNGLRDKEGISNLEFVKSLTKNYSVKIEQKLEEIENNNLKRDDSDFFADESISIVDKIYKLTEEQGLNLTKEEIEKYIT